MYIKNLNLLHLIIFNIYIIQIVKSNYFFINCLNNNNFNNLYLNYLNNNNFNNLYINCLNNNNFNNLYFYSIYIITKINIKIIRVIIF